MDRKTKLWMILLFGLCLVSLGLIMLPGSSGSVAVIRVDGEELRRIDLGAVRESYEISVDTQYGHNTILVEPGTVSVVEANCPDKYCIAQGKLSEGGLMIVCLPHRLTIKLEGSALDG